MTSRISHTTVDAHDAYRQSVWWAEVLGMQEDPEDPNEPGHEECMIFSRRRPDPHPLHRGPRRQAAQEPDPLRPASGRPATRDEEVERLPILGATVVADRRRPDGGWVTMADPEGNEF